MKLPYIKELFLCEDECNALIGLIERYAKGDRNLTAMVRSDMRIEVAARLVYRQGLRKEAELLAKIRDRCQSEIETHLGLACPVYPEFMMLQGNYPGDGHIRHADNRRYDKVTGNWVPNHTPQRVITCGVYLNRWGSDFTGGELVFPALGMTIVQRPGLFVAYPSDERFEHEVPAVQSGARYSVLLWFSHDPKFAEAALVPKGSPADA
jgi:predicted 2-oxoglutarate/Fe(II)-dependent dioxygenase YbiX